MRRLLAICVVLILVMAGAPAAPADPSGFVTVRGRQIVAPDGRPLSLRGVSIGNWLVPEGYMFGFQHAVSPRQIRDAVAELVGPDEARAFWRKWTETYVTADDFLYLRKIGCNSVRIPFNYRLLTPEDHPEVWLEDGFEPLDRAVRWAREAGLWVILDLHCAPGGQTGDNIDDSWGNAWLFESEESQARTVAIWKRIAAHYRDERTVLGYELLNEPIAHFTRMRDYNPRLEPLYKRITAAIREVDPDHLVILGGAQWDNNFDVFGPPFDSKVVYTFHKYWCSTEEKELKPYLDFRAKHDAALWLGESGENTDAWIGAFRRLLERNDIGWCFWPYKKIDATSCMASITRPPHWDEIVRWADTSRGLDFADKRRVRPSPRHAREALQGLLARLPLARCRVNEGFVRALGLTP